MLIQKVKKYGLKKRVPIQAQIGTTRYQFLSFHRLISNSALRTKYNFKKKKSTHKLLLISRNTRWRISINPFLNWDNSWQKSKVSFKILIILTHPQILLYDMLIIIISSECSWWQVKKLWLFANKERETESQNVNISGVYTLQKECAKAAITLI